MKWTTINKQFLLVWGQRCRLMNLGSVHRLELTPTLSNWLLIIVLKGWRCIRWWSRRLGNGTLIIIINVSLAWIRIVWCCLSRMRKSVIDIILLVHVDWQIYVDIHVDFLNSVSRWRSSTHLLALYSKILFECYTRAIVLMFVFLSLAKVLKVTFWRAFELEF